MDIRPAAAPDLAPLADLAEELASAFVALSSDIALVIDPGGSVRQVVQGDAPMAPVAQSWVGRPWVETVTGESRAKIEQLLHDASITGVSRAREVNLPGTAGAGIPVSYAAIRLGQDGPLLAVGRDLRAIAAIQQRFTETQQEMERDYWKRRQAESRYRLLFQVATDAVLVVDALTLNVVEANRAATTLFGLGAEPLAGKPVTVGLERHSWPAVEELLAAARGTGRAAEIRAHLAGGALIDLSATPFRADRDLMLLVRARAVPERLPHSAAPWLDLVQRTPDAVLITDSAGRVMMANPAFLELVQIDSDLQAEGRELAQWVGGAGWAAELIARVKRHGMVAQVPAALRGDGGRPVRVGISAALLDEGDRECIGFTLRPIAGSESMAIPAAEEIAAAVEALGALVGRRTLPELLLAASAIVERHLIRSTLQRCEGDVAAAASLLGVAPGVLDERMRQHAADWGDGLNGLAPSRVN